MNPHHPDHITVRTTATTRPHSPESSKSDSVDENYSLLPLLTPVLIVFLRRVWSIGCQQCQKLKLLKSVLKGLIMVRNDQLVGTPKRAQGGHFDIDLHHDSALLTLVLIVTVGGYTLTRRILYTK